MQRGGATLSSLRGAGAASRVPVQSLTQQMNYGSQNLKRPAAARSAPKPAKDALWPRARSSASHNMIPVQSPLVRATSQILAMAVLIPLELQ